MRPTRLPASNTLEQADKDAVVMALLGTPRTALDLVADLDGFSLGVYLAIDALLDEGLIQQHPTWPSLFQLTVAGRKRAEGL